MPAQVFFRGVCLYDFSETNADGKPYMHVLMPKADKGEDRRKVMAKAKTKVSRAKKAKHYPILSLFDQGGQSPLVNPIPVKGNLSRVRGSHWGR